MPLYLQLADWLRARIRDGTFAPGTRLPSEPELARRHGIGRPTVRQATQTLVQRGLCERRRGSGTFVVPPSTGVDLFSLTGTLASFKQSGIDLQSVLVDPLCRVDNPADPHNPFAERSSYRFVRLSSANGTPVLLEESYLDVDSFPELERYDLARASLSRIVAEQYYRTPSVAHQSFSVDQLSAARARHLRLRNGFPVLLVRRRINFDKAPNAIYSELYCRTDQFELSQQLVAADVRRGPTAETAHSHFPPISP